MHRNKIARLFFLISAVWIFFGLRSDIAASPNGSKTSAHYTGKVNLNTATVDQLTQLPGIGPGKALSIVARRNKRPFRRVRQIIGVKGIGHRTYRLLEPYLAIDGPTDFEKRPAVPVPGTPKTVRKTGDSH